MSLSRLLARSLSFFLCLSLMSLDLSLFCVHILRIWISLARLLSFFVFMFMDISRSLSFKIVIFISLARSRLCLCIYGYFFRVLFFRSGIYGYRSVARSVALFLCVKKIYFWTSLGRSLALLIVLKTFISPLLSFLCMHFVYSMDIARSVS